METRLNQWSKGCLHSYGPQGIYLDESINHPRPPPTPLGWDACGPFHNSVQLPCWNKPNRHKYPWSIKGIYSSKDLPFKQSCLTLSFTLAVFFLCTAEVENSVSGHDFSDYGSLVIVTAVISNALQLHVISNSCSKSTGWHIKVIHDNKKKRNFHKELSLDGH